MSHRSTKKSAVFQYFKLSEKKSHYICQVEHDDKLCNAQISAYTVAEKHGSNAPSRASNLKRHLQRKHPTIYKSIQEHDTEVKKCEEAGSSTSRNDQSSLTKYFHSQKVTVTMTAEIFRKHLIDLVVKNGVALSLFSSQAFRGLNGEMAVKLGVSLERHDIRNIIIEEAENQKILLKKILKDKLLFLKMDACTRQRINYMAINVQFVDDERNLAIRTLAVRDTEAQHSSEYIKNLIEKILKEYDISKQQVLSIVTDNAANMTSAVQKLSRNVSEEEDLFEDISEELSDEESPSVDETLNSAVTDFVGFSNIPHMRCGVHTLQLAIRDGLKERNVSSVIGRLRNIAVAARTPKLDAILKRRSDKGAILDQATRWGSTYEMIKRLLEIKPILIDMANADVTLTDMQWEEARQFEELLKIPYVVTKKYQAADLTPGSFYKEWKTLSYELSKIGGIIADGIRNSMKRREEDLMNNVVFLAAIYVDPMHRILLTDDQLERGKSFLCDVAIRIKSLTEKDSEGNSESEAESCHGSLLNESPPSSSDKEMDFEKYLDQEEKSKRIRLMQDKYAEGNEGVIKVAPLTKFKNEFFVALSKVDKINRKSKLDVKSAIAIYPEIVQSAATIVTALPPTQVSVERLFSALRLIKSHLRANLKEDITEAILFLRTN